jgi:hypothetical protein
MESTAITTRQLKAGREGRFWGINIVFRCRRRGEIRLCHHSLSAAATGGKAKPNANPMHASNGRWRGKEHLDTSRSSWHCGGMSTALEIPPVESPITAARLAIAAELRGKK